MKALIFTLISLLNGINWELDEEIIRKFLIDELTRFVKILQEAPWKGQ